MRKIQALFMVGSLVLAACGSAPTDASNPPGTTSTLPEPGTSSDLSSTTSTAPTTTRPWPESDQAEQWSTISLGVPGTAHLRVAHGPKGFIAVVHQSSGTMVRTSDDGSAWTEASQLAGPEGQEQISVHDIVVADSEYLVSGQAWTNTLNGSEYVDVLWRSPDAVTWTTTPLSAISPHLVNGRIVETGDGLVLAGTDYDRSVEIARPRIFLEMAGEWLDVTPRELNDDGWRWIDGTSFVGKRLFVWGSDSEDEFVWSRATDGTWLGGPLLHDIGHPRRVAFLEGTWILAGDRGVLISPDGADWRLAARPVDFATDAVSEGGAFFHDLYVQDGFIVGVAAVGHRRHPAWCYEDLASCNFMAYTVLLSPDGIEWRRIRLPEELNRIDHPVEAHGLMVDGRLAVVHTLGDRAVLSILESVANAEEINDGSLPAIDFEVVGPDDFIEPGQRYGYPIWTHCGIPAIGPLNETYWVPEVNQDVEFSELLGFGEMVYGFIELVAQDRIEYRAGDQVIAEFHPDPTYEIRFCA